MRLTQRDDQGNWCLKGVPWNCLHPGQVISQELYEKIYGALWKLMEYEDTELTPEEIVDGKMLTGWISVEERLPRRRDYVLCCNVDGVMMIGKVVRQRSGMLCCELLPMSMPDVVAWMPLPEPYRPEKMQGAGKEAGQDAETQVLQSAT